jgi:cytochrome P450
VIRDGEFFLGYASVIGQMPVLHKFILGSPLLERLTPSMETWNPILLWTVQGLNERPTVKREGGTFNTDTHGVDIVSRWTLVKPDDPLKMDERDMIINVSTNLFAGTDTTATALKSVLYYLCRNLAWMDRVVTEIDDADKQGKISQPVTYKQATTVLPYLCAAIKEAMRLHPSVGLLLERHVPEEGLDLPGGYHLPRGTIVGINPWVSSRSEVFGADPERFNPDRWLEAPQSQLREMDTTWEFMFGAGSRKCLGRNVSLIEIHKVFPELLRRYRVELADPTKEWRVLNYWFTQQHDIICKLTRR